MLTTFKPMTGIPAASAAARIARLLEDLAQEARIQGFGGLAESITAAGIEASEEARHASRLKS